MKYNTKKKIMLKKKYLDLFDWHPKQAKSTEPTVFQQINDR